MNEEVFTKMDIPSVSIGDWIKIKSTPNEAGINGYVYYVHEDGSLAVGYIQHGGKGIREDVVWNGEHWKFAITGPCGSYLDKQDTAFIRKGPYANKFT